VATLAAVARTGEGSNFFHQPQSQSALPSAAAPPLPEGAGGQFDRRDRIARPDAIIGHNYRETVTCVTRQIRQELTPKFGSMSGRAFSKAVVGFVPPQLNCQLLDTIESKSLQQHSTQRTSWASSSSSLTEMPQCHTEWEKVKTDIFILCSVTRRVLCKRADTG
jgi:hypothetical protein